jgi:hypothetical protein
MMRQLKDRDDGSRPPATPRWRNPAHAGRLLSAAAGVLAVALVSQVIAVRSGRDPYGTAALVILLVILGMAAGWLGRLPRTAPVLVWAAYADIGLVALSCPFAVEGPLAWREDALIGGVLAALATAVFLMGTGREVGFLAGAALVVVMATMADATVDFLLRGDMFAALAVFGVGVGASIAAAAAMLGRLEQATGALMLLPVGGLALGAAILRHHQFMLALSVSGLSLMTLILFAAYKSGRKNFIAVATIGFAAAWLALSIIQARAGRPLYSAADSLCSLAMTAGVVAWVRRRPAVFGAAIIFLGLGFVVMGAGFARGHGLISAAVFAFWGLGLIVIGTYSLRDQPWVHRLHTIMRNSTKATQ